MAILGKSEITVKSLDEHGDTTYHAVQYGQVNSPTSAARRFRKTAGIDKKITIETDGVVYTGSTRAHYEFYNKKTREKLGSMEVFDG